MTRTLASGKPASKWVFFERRFVIPDYDNPHEPSRIRWRLFSCPYFGIYLHNWYKPDPRSTLHNHPWSFFSIILRGGYSEVVAIPGKTDGQLVKYFNWVPRKKFHTVVMVVPGTWSLMFVGRDHGDWGYLDPEYVPFAEHPHSAEFKKAMEASHL